MASKNTINASIHHATKMIDDNAREASNTIGNTLDSIQDVANKSIYLGVGLAAVVSENIEAFVKDTVKYGEQVEKRQLKKLERLSTNAIDRVKEVFGFSKKTYQRAEQMMEDSLDEVIENLEIPRKSDLRSIDRKLNQIRRNTVVTAKLEKRGDRKLHETKQTTAKLSTKAATKNKANKKAHKTSSVKVTAKVNSKPATHSKSRAASK